MRKKSKPNRYKPDPEIKRARAERIRRILQARGAIMTPVVVLILLSVISLYVHDLVVQSPFFMVDTVEVTGNHRVSREKILELAGLNSPRNIFQINTRIMALQLESNAWIAEAEVDRTALSGLSITLREETALAVVNIRNVARVLVNAQGQPFKEYEPETDQVDDLPEISGIDLSEVDGRYTFKDPLYPPILELIKERGSSTIVSAHSDDTMGLTIKTDRKLGPAPIETATLIPIKLGKEQFREKLARAREIAAYMEKYFPTRAIEAMDLFNLETIFVKTSEQETLQQTVEKGV